MLVLNLRPRRNTDDWSPPYQIRLLFLVEQLAVRADYIGMDVYQTTISVPIMDSTDGFSSV